MKYARPVDVARVLLDRDKVSPSLVSMLRRVAQHGGATVDQLIAYRAARHIPGDELPLHRRGARDTLIDLGTAAELDLVTYEARLVRLSSRTVALGIEVYESLLASHDTR